MAEYGFSLTRIFPYQDRIVDYVLKKERTGQGKPVFTQRRCNTNILAHLLW